MLLYTLEVDVWSQILLLENLAVTSGVIKCCHDFGCGGCQNVGLYDYQSTSKFVDRSLI